MALSLGASLVRVGTTTFSANQWRILTELFNGNATRQATRNLFRSEFDKGFSNETFAAARKIWRAANEAGDAAVALKGDYKVPAADIPSIQTNAARSGWKYSIKSTVYNDNTGQYEPFFTNIQSPTRLSETEMREAVQENIYAAGSEGSLEVTLESLDSATALGIQVYEGELFFS